MKTILLKLFFSLFITGLYNCGNHKPLPIKTMTRDEFWSDSLSIVSNYDTFVYDSSLLDNKDSVFSIVYPRWGMSWGLKDNRIFLPLTVEMLDSFKNLVAFEIDRCRQANLDTLIRMKNISNLKYLFIDDTEPFWDSTKIKFVDTKLELDTLFKSSDLLSNLHELKLSHFGPTIITSKIGNLKNLKWLTLSYNDSLTKLPDRFINLKSLQTIYVNQDSIFDIAHAMKLLSKLPSLKTFRIHILEHDTIPKEIGLLKNLSRLELDLHGKNPKFPDEIENLQNLKELILAQADTNRLMQKQLKSVQKKLPKCQIYLVETLILPWQKEN